MHPGTGTGIFSLQHCLKECKKYFSCVDRQNGNQKLFLTVKVQNKEYPTPSTIWLDPARLHYVFHFVTTPGDN